MAERSRAGRRRSGGREGRSVPARGRGVVTGERAPPPPGWAGRHGDVGEGVADGPKIERLIEERRPGRWTSARIGTGLGIGTSTVGAVLAPRVACGGSAAWLGDRVGGRTGPEELGAELWC